MDKRLELTPQQIAQKYVDEIITDEYLMNIGEIRDLDAISWFDETYPNLTDHQRTLFSEELDRLFPERMIAALERQNKEPLKDKTRRKKNPIRKKQSCSIAFSNASRTTTSLRLDSYWMNITNAINHKGSQIR